MLIEFKIKNYRSYKDEIDFSFEALDDDFLSENVTTVELEGGESVRLLKTAAIFGANASGKSNVIWALHALSSLVANSLRRDVNAGIREYIPYLFDDETKKQPTEVTVDFIVRNKHYQYTIHFNNTLVLFEALYFINRGESRQIYTVENKGQGKNITIGEGWESTALDMSNAKLLPNQLLLSELGTREANGLQEVYSFLATLKAYPIGDVINLKANSYDVAENILKNDESELFDKLRKLIRVADMGIEDIRMKKNGEEDFKFPPSIPKEVGQAFIRDNIWTLEMVHKGGGNILPMQLESVGTKQLFTVGARILNVLNKGGVLVYDEINTAIHSALFRLIVSLFNDPRSNPHHAQLLFTTHDVSIAGMGMLRSDQVWFSEKIDGTSQLFSAQDFEDVGINVPFENWYKSGRFGALPKFGSIDYIFGDYGTSSEKDK